MTNVTTTTDSFEPATDTAAHLFDNWFDPIESGVRERVRGFIEGLIRCELDAALSRPRYGRARNADSGLASIVGHRNGSRTRSLVGSFGKTEITVPRARLQTSNGNDGPMLEALKRLNGGTIHLPGRVKDQPDRDRLALRFERF